MIIEGKHAEVGQGIFISDIQEGSAAEIVCTEMKKMYLRILNFWVENNFFFTCQAGLLVGDMILAVNMDCLLGSTYDDVSSWMWFTERSVTNLPKTLCYSTKIGHTFAEESRGGGDADSVQSQPEQSRRNRGDNKT